MLIPNTVLAVLYSYPNLNFGLTDSATTLEGNAGVFGISEVSEILTGDLAPVIHHGDSTFCAHLKRLVLVNILMHQREQFDFETL
jgi:hypothetical protein